MPQTCVQCRLLLLLACCLFLLVGGSCAAQSDDNATYAQIDCSIDLTGMADFRLSSNNPLPTNHEPIRAAISQAIGGRLTRGSDDQGASDTDLGSYDGWNTHLGTVRGTIETAPLQSALEQSGISTCVLVVSVPSFPYLYAQGFAPQPNNDSPGVFEYPFDSSSPPRLLKLDVGFSPSDLAELLGGMLIVLLGPILLTIWLSQRTARVLSTPSSDRAAIWFGHMRYLNWAAIFTFIGWMPMLFAVGGIDLVLLIAGHTVEPMIPLMFWIPPTISIAVCQGASHPVYRAVGKTQYSGFVLFVRSALFQLRLLPAICIISGFAFFGSNPSAALIWFAAAGIGSVVVGQTLQAIQGLGIKAISSGPLRERVLEIAAKAKVKVANIYVFVTGTAQVANAFASIGQTVTFTDVLLEQLSVREVDAVIAHEATHLKKGHASVRLVITLAFMACSFLLLIHGWLSGTSSPGLFIGYILVVLADIWLVTTISRRFEWTADAGAVALTGDPEAAITGLVKIAALNLTPLAWGKWAGNWIAHPSTRKRAEAIARNSGIAGDWLDSLLSSGGEHDASRYSIPGDPTSLILSAVTKNIASTTLWWLPTILFCLCAACFARLSAYAETTFWAIGIAIAGGAMAILLSRYFAGWLTSRIYRGYERRLEAKVNGGASNAPHRSRWFVGMSPSNKLLIYQGSFDWDIGYLFVDGDRLCYQGDRTQFGVSRSEIEKIELLKPVSAIRHWFQVSVTITPAPVDKAEDGIAAQYSQVRTLAFRPGAARMHLFSKAEATKVYSRLLDWHSRQFEPEANSFVMGEPNFEPATAINARQNLSLRTLLYMLRTSLGAGVGVSILFGLPFLPLAARPDATEAAARLADWPLFVRFAVSSAWYVLFVGLASVAAWSAPYLLLKKDQDVDP